MAIYGPKTKTFSKANPYYAPNRVWYQYQQWYTTKPRANVPLAYLLVRNWFEPQDWNADCDSPNANVTHYVEYPNAVDLTPGAFGARENAAALNRCYDKFRAQVYTESAQTVVNVMERQQVVDAIKTDADVIRKAWRSLRRGDFRGFKRALGLSSRKGESPWSKPEAAGSIWLQYHFGWEPLFQDIFNSVKILQSEYPSRTFTSRASAGGTYEYIVSNGWCYVVPSFRHRYLMQATVHCRNPNLHRANSLGLINPASVIWERVPFSFVVDWFWPIGSFLESWSDFVGLEFENAFTTRSSNATGSQWYAWQGPPAAQYNSSLNCKAYKVERVLSITGPSFPYPKQFKGFSVTRGATAIALCVGALSNERRYFSQTAHRG